MAAWSLEAVDKTVFNASHDDQPVSSWTFLTQLHVMIFTLDYDTTILKPSGAAARILKTFFHSIVAVDALAPCISRPPTGVPFTKVDKL